jgi:hypothetical protein
MTLIACPRTEHSNCPFLGTALSSLHNKLYPTSVHISPPLSLHSRCHHYLLILPTSSLLFYSLLLTVKWEFKCNPLYLPITLKIKSNSFTPDVKTLVILALAFVTIFVSSVSSWSLHLGIPVALVSSGCHNKIPQNWWFKHQKFVFT